MRASMLIAVGTSSTMPTIGGQLLAQGAEPQPEQSVGALQDGADDGARAALGVIAGGERHGPLEGLGHGGKVPAVGEAVGEDGDHDAGNNAEKAQKRPQGDIGKGRFAPRQGVDDAPEKDRLGELHEADGNRGQGQQGGQPPLGAQHAERAPGKSAIGPSPARPSPPDLGLLGRVTGPNNDF